VLWSTISFTALRIAPPVVVERPARARGRSGYDSPPEPADPDPRDAGPRVPATDRRGVGRLHYQGG
jgi:hypothetical protein